MRFPSHLIQLKQICFLILGVVIIFGIGYFGGVEETQKKFSTGGCWVEKDTTDIVCIAYTE